MMIGHNVSLVTISDKIVFNENYINTFENFSVEDTKLLFGTLLLNLIENLRLNQSEADIFIYAESNDNNFIQTEIASLHIDKLNLLFFDKKPDLVSLFPQLKTYKNIIFVYADVMGFSYVSVKEILRLLSTDENTVVIGTSKDSSVCFIGVNNQTENLLTHIQDAGRDYSKLLSLLKTEEHFIHTLNGFVRVCDIQSFKDLYADLSQKKSIEYCTQEMHEKFTHLFVEYKDLLK